MHSWSDASLSILLGLTTSITRDSLLVERCPFPTSYAEEIAASLPENNPIFQKKLEELVSQTLEEKDKEFEQVLDSVIKGNHSGQSLVENTPTVWLKTGAVIQGNIITQDSEFLEMEDLSGKRHSFNKQEILRVRMR